MLIFKDTELKRNLVDITEKVKSIPKFLKEFEINFMLGYGRPIEQHCIDQWIGLRLGRFYWKQFKCHGICKEISNKLA